MKYLNTIHFTTWSAYHQAHEQRQKGYIRSNRITERGAERMLKRDGYHQPHVINVETATYNPRNGL